MPPTTIPDNRSIPAAAPPRRSALRRLVRRGLSPLVALLVPLSLSLVPAATVHASTATYYVDCAGSDTNSGTSASSPWQSLSKANSASLGPGSSLLFKRGCSWTGPLTAKWTGSSSAPVTIGAYGTGSLPLIQNAHEDVAIYGSYQLIEDIATKAAPTGYDSGCQNWPTGWRVGFRFFSGAAYNTVQHSTATGLYIGILADSGSHDNRVLGNSLVNNNMGDPNPSTGAGGVGISLMGDRNEVAGNTISGSDMCSRAYGRDGAAVEIYGGRDNTIHHNRANQNNAFTELGNSRSANNTFAYNQVISSLPKALFLVTRGANDPWGPVYGTKVYNSSVYLSSSGSYAIQCTGGCAPTVLTLHDNIVWANGTVGYSDAAFDEANNIYWSASGSPKVWFPISPSSRKVSPGFASLAATDLHITSSSPALNRSCSAAISLGFRTDLDGTALPQGPSVDIGAHELAAGTSAPISPGTTVEARGVAPDGPWTRSSLATPIGTYITFRMRLGPAYAGKVVGVLEAHRSIDGAWGSYVRITSRYADSNGDVVYYRRGPTPGWWSYRATYPGDVSTPATITGWAMAHWY